MSILIKDMKMPKKCTECLMRDPISDYCELLFRYLDREELNGRDGDCPLVELPEKHGDLIDRDALIRDHFSPEHRIALSEANKTWMRKIINDAPTIVESDGE